MYDDACDEHLRIVITAQRKSHIFPQHFFKKHTLGLQGVIDGHLGWVTLFLSAYKRGISSESSEVPDSIFCSEPLLLSKASHHHSICHDLKSIAKTLQSWHELTASCMRPILPLVYQCQVLLLDDPFRLPVCQSAFSAVQHMTHVLKTAQVQHAAKKHQTNSSEF